MIRKFAIAASLAACATSAAASDWIYVGQNSYGSTYELDRETLTRSGAVVTFWLRVHYGPNLPQQSEVDSYRARREADCNERSYRDLQTDYMKAGQLLRSSGEEEKRLAAPDSIAAGVIAKACSL